MYVHTFNRAVNEWFKKLASEFPLSEYKKRQVAFATVDLSNAQNLFMRVIFEL